MVHGQLIQPYRILFKIIFTLFWLLVNAYNLVMNRDTLTQHPFLFIYPKLKK